MRMKTTAREGVAVCVKRVGWKWRNTSGLPTTSLPLYSPPFLICTIITIIITTIITQ